MSLQVSLNPRDWVAGAGKLVGPVGGAIAGNQTANVLQRTAAKANEAHKRQQELAKTLSLEVVDGASRIMQTKEGRKVEVQGLSVVISFDSTTGEQKPVVVNTATHAVVPGFEINGTNIAFVGKQPCIGLRLIDRFPTTARVLSVLAGAGTGFYGQRWWGAKPASTGTPAAPSA